MALEDTGVSFWCTTALLPEKLTALLQQLSSALFVVFRLYEDYALVVSAC